MARLKTAKSSAERKISDLIKEVERLKEVSHSKDELIRIINHELRTPLDIIRGNLDMVLKGETGEINSKTKEYLSDALSGADRLTQIVNDLLDTSRVETGRMTFALEDIDIRDILLTVEKEFKPIAESKKVKLSFRLPPGLSAIFSDKAKVFQILNNIIGNALKFIPESGSVIVEVKVEDETVLISVKDTGIGLKKEDMSKLFRRFPEIDTSTSGVARGTGLGLYLVWQIVEKLGGEVWAESEGLGKGSMFLFRLPKSGTERAEELSRFHKQFFQTLAIAS